MQKIRNSCFRSTKTLNIIVFTLKILNLLDAEVMAELIMKLDYIKDELKA